MNFSTILLLLLQPQFNYATADYASNNSVSVQNLSPESDDVKWLLENINLTEDYIFPELTSVSNYPELSEAVTKYAQYGATTYCPRKGRLTFDEDNNKNLLNEVCDTKFCESTENVYVRKLIQTDITSLILEDSINKELIICFKGTSGRSDWLINLNYPLEKYEPLVLRDKLTKNKFECDKPRLHRGFNRGYTSFHNSGAMEYVIKFMKQNPDYDIVVTGHSMGGAISEICAVELSIAGFRPTVFNFGTPKVFNKELADWVDSRYGLYKDFVKGGFYRVITKDDLVVLFPLSQQGFYHVGSEVCINADFEKETIVSMSVLGKFNDKREKLQFQRLVRKLLRGFRSHLIKGIESIFQAEAHKYYPVSMNCSK